MRLLNRFGIVLLLAIGVVACGGGGGGDEEEPPCQAPGTLATVAVEGRTAPGTGGERYRDFPLTTPMDAADGGWLAFVARVTASTCTSRSCSRAWSPPTTSHSWDGNWDSTALTDSITWRCIETSHVI